MKSDLAKKLLSNILEPILKDEDEAVSVFEELQFLSEYKYDHYEMYSAGRHFLEHFYLWIKQFRNNTDRKIALDFVRNHLIFISRQEFEILTDVLYWEIVKPIHFDIVSSTENIPRYQVNSIAQSLFLKEIESCSLYIGLSDGARMDYFRRQNKAVGNEQVLTSYHVDQHKCDDMIKKLENSCGKGKRFRLVFLLDDFCASGTTLIRISESGDIKGTLSRLENKVFPIVEGKGKEQKVIKWSLLNRLLSEDAKIFLCPLIATKNAVDHVRSSRNYLTSQLRNIEMRPVSILDDKLSITSTGNPIGDLCERYYQNRMGDEHTGDVTFGYKNCGLTLTLHHNTPNNSLYLLWNRLATEPDGCNQSFEPLFKRIERHRSIEE